MTLEVDVRARYGAFSLDVAMTTQGRLTALFGPSGSGKTSLMEIIGGIRRPASGRVVLDGDVLSDADAGRFVPPHRRRIGWVFQEARLFPHLTGRQNLFYGRLFTPRAARTTRLDDIVDLLGIAHLLDRRPAHFSGGEKSRVAIGRALMSSPRLLMMDEPLAALDATRKAEILPYIERLRDEGSLSIVYVTHAIDEVARLADEVVLIAAGRVVAKGTTSAVLSRFDLGGALGDAEAGAVIETVVAEPDAGFGLSRLDARAGSFLVPQIAQPTGHPVRLRIKARDVLISRERLTGLSALNQLAGTITTLAEGAGGRINLTLDCGGDRLLASVTAKSAHDLGLSAGVTVFAIVKSVSFDRLGLGGSAPTDGHIAL